MNENGQESLSDFEAARSRLRQRWELASVLNFFKVFEPVIETNLKISAEDVEMALILPNKSLAQIHIALLKGIPPVSKTLKDPDAWVVALSKKLIMWWPWVAEGDFPLTAAKGAEMSTYKELDPTIRLVILKALCEIRADQHDVVEYINDGVRNKNEMSTFRKNNIGQDEKGTSYWHDGNEILGFRLYKEVNTFKKKETETTISCQWETLATNLEEFQKVVDEYSSSKSKLEVAVSSAVETEVIPILNKLQKKRQRELQKKMNEERVINNFCRTGITRSCRSSKPIKYTFDEYDKAINEAIRETKKIKPKEEKKEKKKEIVVKEEDSDSTESGSESKSEDVSEDGSEESGEEKSHESDDENNENESSGEDENTENESSGEDENNENESSGEDEDEMVLDSEDENGRTKGSKKVSDDDDDDGCNGEMDRNFGAKKRLRQRPNRNTAFVADSEDEIMSSENSDS